MEGKERWKREKQVESESWKERNGEREGEREMYKEREKGGSERWKERKGQREKWKQDGE